MWRRKIWRFRGGKQLMNKKIKEISRKTERMIFTINNLQKVFETEDDVDETDMVFALEELKEQSTEILELCK